MQPSHVAGQEKLTLVVWYVGNFLKAGSYVLYGMLNNSSNPCMPPQSFYNSKTIHAQTINQPINTCSVQKLPGLSISLWEFIWGI